MRGCGAVGDPGQGSGCVPHDRRLRLGCALAVGLPGCWQKNPTLVDLCNREVHVKVLGGSHNEEPRESNVRQNKSQVSPCSPWKRCCWQAQKGPDAGRKELPICPSMCHLSQDPVSCMRVRWAWVELGHTHCCREG